MGRVIAITNPKGGIGRTAVAVNLAAALARRGRSVLLLDLAPEAAAARALGNDPLDDGALSLLREDPSLPAPRGCAAAGVEVTAAGTGLLRHEDRLFKGPDPERRVRRALAPLRSRYDVVVTDAPPAAGLLPRLALAAADHALVLCPATLRVLEDADAALEFCRKVKKEQNEALDVMGVLLARTGEHDLDAEAEAKLRDRFGDAVFEVTLPRDQAVPEAARRGLSVIDYAPTAPAAWAFSELAKEVDAR